MLMKIFTDSSKYDFERFPKVSGRKQQFKVDEGGDRCKILFSYNPGTIRQKKYTIK